MLLGQREAVLPQVRQAVLEVAREWQAARPGRAQDVSAGLLAVHGPRQRGEQPAAELVVRLVVPLPIEVQAVSICVCLR